MIDEIIKKIEQIKESALLGEISELEGYIFINDIEKKIIQFKDELKAFAINTAETYGAKSFEAYGRKIELKSKRTYQYNHCKYWIDANNKRKEVEERMKIAATSNLDVDSETGEQITPAIVKISDFLVIK